MTRVVRPTDVDMQGHSKLDMRVSSAVGEDLAAEIVHSIDHSQTFIMTTLPDQLIVTQKQFFSLQPYTEQMYNTTDRMYVTPRNAMEVIIDRNIDTIDEVENVIAETEALQHVIDEAENAEQEKLDDDSAAHQPKTQN